MVGQTWMINFANQRLSLQISQNLLRTLFSAG
ncbi:Uncharacterised protein [Vibrio cholerae]|nr:Uncharacterised protein [Vibrio cholerae]